MLHKTRGVVFKYFKYRDTSIIVKVFTEAFGLQTYIVNGVRSKSSRSRIALYQPITLLDMVVYKKNAAEINRISEVKCNHPFLTISTDIKKTYIAIFLAEVLYKCVKEEEEDVSDLFNFIFHSIEILDHLESGYENFHLQFLLKLSHYLGFGVESPEDHFLTIDNEELKILTHLVNNSYEEHIKMSNNLRRNLLDHIVRFYKVHIESLKEINSLNILKEVI
ncbi:DNA repair protein RecO [Fulvivirga maritima]|uniref:DNA repair protein RecO n=1 Tax=Fulvivirga maritima TaxID=2904247 RepID=UPI001F19A350|nr:DNA repair protein RecO [Fulvivirga maritima]UII28842.1 DNA repair protein RecO [Fulvivirga maritima]